MDTRNAASPTPSPVTLRHRTLTVISVSALAVAAAACDNRVAATQTGGTTGASVSDAGDAGAISDAGNAADAGPVPDAGDAGDGGDAGLPSDAGAAPDSGSSGLNVLFIGNSYTYVNDLPGMLSQIAATAGVPPTIATSQVVQGGATLEVQWDNGIAQTQIEQGGWTHVVLQGQSLEPLFFYDFPDFYAYGEMFEKLIVDAGARPTLFVTWARAAGDSSYTPQYGGYYFSPDEMQDQLTSSYAYLARQTTNGLLACAGEAFRTAIEQYPGIVLQQSDLSHPTVAGTYLAACTFYVALTGQAVPAQSFVPDGVSAEDAASLRDVALVGANCADVQPKGFVLLGDGIENGQRILDLPNPDGGPEADPPFDFGTAGSSVTDYFLLTNYGETAAGIEDGMTLRPPFAWAGDSGYPGGSGTITTALGTYSFCSGSVPAATAGGIAGNCVVAVSYSGEATGSGVLTLNLTNDYQPGLARGLQGTSTSRALLRISQDPGDFGCSDACGGASVSVGATTSLIVTNRGGAPTTSLGVGTPLASPFYWGDGDGGAFPGGAGVGSEGGQSYDYCTTQTLGPGQCCLLTVSLSPPTPDGGSYMSAVNIAYSDATGPVTPNANENVSGSDPLPFGPKSGD
jgi:hypothetical protein